MRLDELKRLMELYIVLLLHSEMPKYRIASIINSQYGTGLREGQL